VSKRVLIADDGEFFRAALRDMLSRGGYEVVGEASNGAEAIEKARDLAPDIVILDVVMPIKNGLEAAREITEMRLPLRIVMCSSIGHEPVVEDAMRAGASAYILKPLNEKTVLDTLNGLDPDA
jgi:two-component system chemotaxis response regulator CheY